MDKNDFENLEKKTLQKGWGEKKITPDYEVYKEEDTHAKKLGWQGALSQKREFRKTSYSRIWWVLLFVVAAISLIYFYYSTTPVFDPQKINMDIAGPSKISSGEYVSFKVSYKNNSKVTLRDVNLSFEWPAGYTIEGSEYKEPVVVDKDVKIIMPNQEKLSIFEGRMYGEKDTLKTVKAKLTYTPEGLQNSFTLYKEFEIGIENVPVFLNVSLPSQIVAEKESDIKVEYINKSDASFSNMEIRAEYPTGFEFISSTPNPAISNNIWQLGTVQGGEEASITIRGKFSGAEGEAQIISFEIGKSGTQEEDFLSLASALAETHIASSALLVYQTANGSRDAYVKPGGVINYTINYKNTTDTQISNAVIIAQIDPSLIDIKTLAIPFGFLDGRTNSIIWNQKGVPELAVLDPKEEGSVKFSIRTISGITPKSASDKNLVVKTTVKIASGSTQSDTEGIPIDDQDSLEVKISTIAGLNVVGYHDGGIINNFGPMPPKVGQETAYSFSWQIVDTTNDLKDVVVQASVPAYVKWTGVVEPPDSGLNFDMDRGIITWNAGTVFAGSGFVHPVKKVDFQISVVPSIIDVGKSLDLVSNVTMTAKDLFTGEDVNLSAPSSNTTLKGAVTSDMSRVIQ